MRIKFRLGGDDLARYISEQNRIRFGRSKLARRLRVIFAISITVVCITAIAGAAYLVMKNTYNPIPQNKLAGVWHLERAEPWIDMTTGEPVSEATMDFDTLSQLIGEYILFYPDGTYADSAACYPKKWIYDGSSLSLEDIDGNVTSSNTETKGGLLGNTLMISRYGYALFYSKVGDTEEQDTVVASVKNNNPSEGIERAETSQFIGSELSKVEYGEDTSGTKVIPKKDMVVDKYIFQEYDLLSNMGYVSKIVLNTNNVVSVYIADEVDLEYNEYEEGSDSDVQLYTGDTVTDESAADRDAAYSEMYSEKVTNINRLSGRYKYTSTGIYFLGDDFGEYRMNTRGKYLFSAVLEGKTVPKPKITNAVEEAGYLLEANVKNNITGITYKLHIDGTANVILADGKTLDYTYSADEDGLVTLVPRTAMGYAMEPDYLFYETDTNRLYRVVYTASSWSNYIEQ